MQHREPSASPSRGRSLTPQSTSHTPDRPVTSPTNRSRSLTLRPRISRGRRSSSKNRRDWSTPIDDDFDLWRQHDVILRSNRNLAERLERHIERLKPRFEEDQLDTLSRVKFYSLQENVNELESANDLVQKTFNLYSWEDDDGRAQRAESPMNTLPASESRYATAIGVEGDLPVSPLRALICLNMMLKDKWDIVAKLDPQGKMSEPEEENASVNF